MKKVLFIGALALGLMSFNSTSTDQREILNDDCHDYALEALELELEFNQYGFTSDGEMFNAYMIWYTQCLSLNEQPLN